MAPQKIIIDTDPGCDDVLAMLLAFSALPDELQVLMVSVTFGNVDVESCLRNVVAMFHYIKKELEWREHAGQPLGFESLRQHKPVVAAGANRPLHEQQVMADFFHGRDGLGDISDSHPHLNPMDTWDAILERAAETGGSANEEIIEELSTKDHLFIPSHKPAHEEILRLLKENESGTITIVAIGPLTNLAVAAAADPVTFLRAKEVVVMGGAVHIPGNITPLAEFNTFADSIAAARVYALSAPRPSTTMPPIPLIPAHSNTAEVLPLYPQNLPSQLKIVLFPLDITNRHLLTQTQFNASVEPLASEGSPLATWTIAWMKSTYDKIRSLRSEDTDVELGLQLHDPLTIWYCMSPGDNGWRIRRNEDIRVETAGQWTRGACVTDQRSRPKRGDDDTSEQPGDHGKWLQGGTGNRLGRCIESPGEKIFGGLMLERIFAPGPTPSRSG